MLREFGALPTEDRVKEMKDRDYLWCLIQQLLDREEELEQMCPQCRTQIQQERCPCCGTPRLSWGESGTNAAFDWQRFEQMQGGERP